ncbi:MAG: hypothetical protein FWH20_07510 [Oscillospiraceae bacterium]|nr:hypothetical protein [Oscillospiraceae bacterium]
MVRNYGEFSACELREKLLSNTLDTDLMSLEDYEKLFGHEIELDEPSDAVLDFCNTGLNRYEYYGRDLPKPAFETILKHRKYRNVCSDTKISRPRTKRLVVAIAVILITLLLAATATATVRKLSLNYLFSIAAKSADKTPITYNDLEIICTDDYRVYKSIDELLEAEKINILHPPTLPGDYEFTDFKIADNGSGVRLTAYSREHKITFSVDFGKNFHHSDYQYEINNITFQIREMKNYFQAGWNYKEDYYIVVAYDEAMLLEIINSINWED